VQVHELNPMRRPTEAQVLHAPAKHSRMPHIQTAQWLTMMLTTTTIITIVIILLLFLCLRPPTHVSDAFVSGLSAHECTLPCVHPSEYPVSMISYKPNGISPNFGWWCSSGYRWTMNWLDFEVKALLSYCGGGWGHPHRHLGIRASHLYY